MAKLRDAVSYIVLFFGAAVLFLAAVLFVYLMLTHSLPQGG